MSRGAYMTDAQDFEDFHGTFYYYEPGSNIYLSSTSTLVVPNKIIACLYLYDFFQTLLFLVNPLTKYGEFSRSNEDMYFPGRLDEYVKNLYDGKYLNWKHLINRMLSSGFDFTEHRPEMYAMEDRFDQILCRGARRLKIDVILLTTMNGETRVVSEILDTRQRAESYKNLFQL